MLNCDLKYYKHHDANHLFISSHDKLGIAAFCVFSERILVISINWGTAGQKIGNSLVCQFQATLQSWEPLLLVFIIGTKVLCQEQ